MNSFSKVEDSDKSFNVTFSVTLSIVFSLLIIGILTFFGLYNLPNGWFIYGALILFPVIVYGIAESQSTEYQMAYYKKWVDSILGVLDRKKILNDFTQKYGISTYKTKVSDIKADGRWHFKVSTDHVRSLIIKKNEILSHLEVDRVREETRLKERITYQETILQNELAQKSALDKEEEILDRLLKEAKTTKETFKQRRDFEILSQKINAANKRINEAKYEVTIAKDQKDKLIKEIENATKRAKDYYYVRYQNYTSRAIKAINAINGLKYKIEDMGEEK